MAFQPWMVMVAIAVFSSVTAAFGAYWGVRLSLVKIEEQIRFLDFRITKLEDFQRETGRAGD